MAVFVASSGGGNGSANNSSSSTFPDVTGNWHMTATSFVNNAVMHFDGSLVIDESNLNRNVLSNLSEDVPDPACGINIVGGVLNGNKRGQTVPLAGGPSQSGADITISLTAADANSLVGSYSVPAGCADKGNVTGVRVPSLAGSWNGTMDGGATTLSATLSQDRPSLSTINGSFDSPLSGDVEFGASGCFSSGPLAMSSSVWGDIVELDIAMADGLMLSGRGSVSDPATAKAMTFSYIIKSPTGAGGRCVGQTGTFTVNR